MLLIAPVNHKSSALNVKVIPTWVEVVDWVVIGYCPVHSTVTIGGILPVGKVTVVGKHGKQNEEQRLERHGQSTEGDFKRHDGMLEVCLK